jgi:hypothetical protein
VDNQPLRFAAEYRIDNPASKNPALLAIGVSLRDVSLRDVPDFRRTVS